MESNLILCCPECGSIHVVKNGKNACGTQVYKCKDCGCSRVLQPKCRTTKVDKDAVIRAYTERNSLRGIARIFDISVSTVFLWLKKKPAN